ncbi:HK97 family phage prohead protease [Sphingomonas sp. CV7422]|uniref:HK97 family phage prohead protease n=1 Tax=Sphingomonas sp. CV7422 TaxID=3018036 RepID=UPI003FA6D9ED
MSWRAGIHGYVARWGVVTGVIGRPHAPHLARPARFERNCFSYDAATVEIWFMHREAQKVGGGKDIGLQIWSDDYGLAFAFKPPSTAWSLVCGISEGRYDQCSAGYDMEAATTQRQGNVFFDSVSRATLNEISICPRGACPGAVCWHAAAHPLGLPPHAAALLPIWEASRVISQRAA